MPAAGARPDRALFDEVASGGVAEGLFLTSYEKSKVFDPDVWEFFPPSPREFVESDEYCGMRGSMYECHVEDLEDFFGAGNPFVRRYDEWIDIEGIGSGKSFKAGMLSAYVAAAILHLRDPAAYLGELGTGIPLQRGSKIAIMNVSINATNAHKVVFGEIKSKIDRCTWFRRHYPPNPIIQSELQFDVPPMRRQPDPDHIYKCVYIIPGSSSENTALGYNLFLGLLDEAAFYSSTENKDAAEEVFSHVSSRITSRFGTAGIIASFSSPKYVNDFMERRFRNERLQRIKRTRRATWEAKYPGWNGPGFLFDADAMRAEPDLREEAPPPAERPQGSIWVHRSYHEEFLRNPELSLRNYGARPSAAVNRFFSNPRAIEDNAEPDLLSPVARCLRDGTVEFHDWFGPSSEEWHFIHVDASSMSGKDATAFAMTHLDHVDDEGRPHIWIDLIIRFQGTQEEPIQMAAIRRLIEQLHRMGFPLGNVTFDGYVSPDTMQQLANKGIPCEYLSVDRTVGPYTDLKEAVYEDRLIYYVERTAEEPLEMYNARTVENLSHSEAFISELMNVEEVRKGGRTVIDHSPHNSKDVADAVAGAVHHVVVAARKRERTSFRMLEL